MARCADVPKECLKLPAAEWDFEKIPEKEQRACLYYECGRESTVVKQAASLWNKHIPDGDGFPFKDTLLEHDDFFQKRSIPQAQLVLIKACLSTDFRVVLGLDSFPNKPWQDIAAQTRSDHLKRIGWDNFPSPLRMVSDKPLSKFQQPDSYPVYWGDSDTFLIESFSRWVKENRPVKADTVKRGRVEKSSDLLNQLGWFRLSRFAQQTLGNKSMISEAAGRTYETDRRNRSRACKKS